MALLTLHPDRHFDPSTRKIARDLYEGVCELPLVCPHGHVDPALLARNERLPEPSALIIRPDHYVLRMLYSQGVPMEALGIPVVDGGEVGGAAGGDPPVETDPRAIWRRFAERYHLFQGTPTRSWLDHELYETLGIRTKLDGDSAMRMYDEIEEKLAAPEFLPRALFDRFRIEVLTTTDGAADSLKHHEAIRNADWNGRVVPCFRPDALFNIASPGWPAALSELERAVGKEISGYGAFAAALEDRTRIFQGAGRRFHGSCGAGAVYAPAFEARSIRALRISAKRSRGCRGSAAVRGASGGGASDRPYRWAAKWSGPWPAIWRGTHMDYNGL